MDPLATMSLPALIASVFSFVVKPFVLLVLVVTIAKLLGKRSAVNQHLLLLFGFIALALLPLALATMPAIELEVLPASLASTTVIAATAMPWLMASLGIWLLGTSWIIIYLALGIIALYRLRQHSSPIDWPEDEALIAQLKTSLGVHQTLEARYHESVPSPFVWGLNSPIIMMPPNARNWDKRIKQYVYMHEITHIARRDWLSMVFVRLCCAVFWFLPPVWLAAKRMHEAAEMACDESVYRLSEDETAYAQNLLSFAVDEQNKLQEPGLGVSAGSPVYQRVQALLDRKRERTQTASEGWSPALVCLFVLLLPYGAIQLAVPSSTHNTVQWLTTQWLSLAEKPPLNRVEKAPELTLSLEDWHKRKQYYTAINRAPAKMEQLVFVAIKPTRAEFGIEKLHTNTLRLNVPHSRVSIQGLIPQKVFTPIYPNVARRRGIEGRVEVTFDISPRGQVQSPKITHSQPKGIFDDSVIRAVKQFEFQEPLINGETVTIKNVTETFIFVLEKAPLKVKRRQP